MTSADEIFLKIMTAFGNGVDVRPTAVELSILEQWQIDELRDIVWFRGGSHLDLLNMAPPPSDWYPFNWPRQPQGPPLVRMGSPVVEYNGTLFPSFPPKAALNEK